MLTVRNLRPVPTRRDWLIENSRLLIALTIWATALLWLAGSVPTFMEAEWYGIRLVEGSLVYDRLPDEVACRAIVVDDSSACLSGSEID